MQLRIVPVRLRTAKDFVTDHHRHHRAPLGAVFSVGLAHGDRLVGVAIAGRPVARGYDDGWTIEITRVCVSPEAQKGSCSKLIAACRRAAFALSYTRVCTYTQASESGASLRGAGMDRDGITSQRNGGWSSREGRADSNQGQKIRWIARRGSGSNHERPPTYRARKSTQTDLFGVN